jgi:hypothetical protein
MNDSKEFQVEYSIWAPISRNGNFQASGNPFDREDILTHIAYHVSQQGGEPVDWSQILRITYKISETTRLLDSAWDSYHEGEATAEEMVKLVGDSPKGGETSKIEKLREMHRRNDG